MSKTELINAIEAEIYVKGRDLPVVVRSCQITVEGAASAVVVRRPIADGTVQVFTFPQEEISFTKITQEKGP